MGTPLRILIVEDSEDEAILLLRQIRRSGYEPVSKRVDTASEMKLALAQDPWDVVIADFAMPRFSATGALSVLQESGLDLPFIIVSGAIKAEDAVAAMRAGAHDYLMKDDLVRLVPAIERELREASGRHARRNAEEALRKSEDRLQQILASVSNSVYMTEVTASGNYDNSYVSPNIEAITGYKAEEFLEIHDFWYKTVVHPEDKPIAFAFRAELPEGTNSEIEYKIVRADGETVWVRESARLEGREDGSGVIYGVINDVTERRYLEDQLRHSQKMEAVGQLAGGIAHDFNNILMIIVGYSDLLLTRHLSEDDSLRNDLEEIRKAGERAAALTRQLLVFSRKQVLQPRILNLNYVFAGIEKMLRRLLSENIDLKSELAPDLKETLADQGQIEQIIVNLAVNARDAMPHGGVLRIKTTNIYLDECYAHRNIGVRPGQYVMLAVSDTGIGINKETKSRMFEPFFTTKKAGKGTGLGLATVYAITQKNSGHIAVESKLGEGATFKIYLPVAGEAQREKAVIDQQPGQSRGPETILVIEDEADVREVTCKFLRHNGYDVLDASCGGEALKVSKAYAGPIHLILTDVVMPDTNGRKLAAQLQLIYPQSRVLYMSGYADDAIIEQGFLEAGVAFLRKPFDAQTLARTVRKVLDA